MTRGNFDLHFTPVEEMDRMAPYHFAVELVFHARRPHPPVPQKEPAATAAGTGGVPGTASEGNGAESAEQARAELTAAEAR